jgi:hypothetical protein
MCSGGLFGGDVIDVCSSDAEPAFGGGTAASTFAALLNGAEVVGVDGIAKV